MAAADKDILKPLVDQTVEKAADPAQEEKKRLWADHQSLGRTGKIPVCVWYEYIPEPQWQYMLGDSRPRTGSEVARLIERDLHKRLWMAEHVPDDHILWPSIVVPAVLANEVSWGVCFGMAGTDGAVEDPLEARKMVPAFPDGIRPQEIRFSDLEVDQEATLRRVEEARELAGDRLSVAVSYPDLGYSPFDMAVQMRGLQRIMYDVVDAPQQVRALMERITACFERHHENREKKGWLNVVVDRSGRYAQVGFRVHCAYPASDFDPGRLRLKDEWAYISAQTASGLSPAMFEEFVQPFNVCLARYFTNQTVYYHGCECLDHRLDILAKLPNLRRFHVSPWSSVEKARRMFAGQVVLEVHAHPGRVFFGYTKSEMKAELERLVRAAEGAPLDLNLSDIHSVNGNPDLLRQWAEAAQELAEKI